MDDLPVLVLGAGGHGRVVASALLLTGRRVIGFLDADRSLWGTSTIDLPIIGDDVCLQDFSPESVRLVNGIGSTALSQIRKKIFEDHKVKGFSFESVIHPSACVSPGAMLGEGAQVMAGAVIQIGAKIGCNVIINTGAIVDHDSVIGAHTHVAPGATLSGGVAIGCNCHIGAGAVMIQSVELGDESMVGAGAVVIRSHAASSYLVGVPAKMMRTK